jgi:REP element-mobilizing transposase RayT
MMEFDDAFAWLVTWTTYGTWLPGDPRGNVSPVLQADGTYEKRINTPGAEWAAGNERTRKRAGALQRCETVCLDGEEAYAAAESIADAAASRKWLVPRAAVMATHVHVVLQDAGGDSSAASRVLKGVSQAALSEHCGATRRWWTRGGSERGLRGAEAIAAAIQYVAEQEGMLAEIIDNIPSRRVNPAGR